MKVLSSLRKKILIGFLFAIITLISVGIITFYSLEKMLFSIDEFGVPDKSVSMMYEISTDLGLISNYNRIYSISNDRSYQLKIETTAEETLQEIDSLAILLSDDSSKLNQIDSLKLLVAGITGESKKLALARSSIDADKITARLAQQILEQVKSDSTLISDSSFIIKNTTSKIRESSFELKESDSLLLQNEKLKDISFFQKLGFLFSKKRPSGLIDTLYVLPDKKVDTLMTVSKDSVIYLTKDLFINKLDSLLKEIQKEESQVQNQINQMELDFTHHNNEMIEKARSILNSINQSTIQSTFEEIDTISTLSKKSKSIILSMILLFVIVGVVLIVLVSTDISKNNYYQEELLNAKRISDASAKAKLDFLAKMSHEIRTPITSIVGFSAMLKNQKNDYVKIIQEASQQLLNTANEILDLAKVDSGIIDIHNEPVDFINFLNQLMMDYQMRASSAKFDFEYEIQNSSKLIVSSDKFRLNQILTNILNNAFKFTESGKVSFTCHHKNISDETVEVLIRIRDTGPGIDKNDLQKIFLEYEQVGSATLKKQGFGLGLSIVKKLIHLLNGTIQVDSQAGIGTTFSLRFEFKKAALKASTDKVKSEPNKEILKGRRFLIVDDDITILKLFSTILKKYGAQTSIAKNPGEMWQLLKSDKYDLCLMDIQLSGHSGADLCRQLKSNKEYKDLYIIASTANLIGTSKETLLRIGFDHVFFKPVEENTLILEVCKMLKIKTETLTNKSNGRSIKTGKAEGINFDELHKFTLGDDRLLKEIVEQFIIDTEKDIELLYQSINENNKQLMKDVLHRLSSRLAQFGAKALAEQSKSVEQILHENEEMPSEDARELLHSCQRLLIETKKKLTPLRLPK